MRAYLCVAILISCLLPGCVDYTGGLCIPHVDTFCYQGKTYWVDSCAALENVLEECECGCRADQYSCRTCGEKECETDADCPEGFFCDPADWLCKMLNCVPECTGRCCGTDGCSGTCPNTCPPGDRCNPGTCRCEGETECRTNSDCPRDYWCDRTTWRCRPIDCIPNCTGKCCGSDGCSGTCPNNCPMEYDCNWITCQCEPYQCATDADCMMTQCCAMNTCVDMNCGTLECGPDPVCGNECGPCRAGYHCDMGRCIADIRCTTDAHCPATQCCIAGTCVPMACGALECGPDPVCGKECGPCQPPDYCVNGVCEYWGEDPCPPGQECVDITESGYRGCIIPPNIAPPENQTGCNPQYGDYCDGNYTCHCMNDTCSESVCIENCGTCPGNMACFELWDNGPWGCLKSSGALPDNYPTCDTGICEGNMTCYGLSDGGTICIDNCSVEYGPCVDGQTRCLGEFVQTCAGGAWVDTADCTATNQVCYNGTCVIPPVLGEFCEDIGKCAAGLDCLGTVNSTHQFCAQQCDCTSHTGCQTGWECLFTNADPPTTCWCAKLCTTAADCPDGGAGGYSCIVIANDGNNDIYGCMVN